MAKRSAPPSPRSSPNFELLSSLPSLRIQHLELSFMVSAIIVAAGSSRRMGFDKLFAPLAGKPVLWHSLKAFNDCKDVDEILVVTRGDQMDEVEHLVSSANLRKVTKVIE